MRVRQPLIPERMPEADDGLCCTRHELLAGYERGLAEGREEFLSRLVFPSVAHRERESLAHIVVLQLVDELHVGREVNDEVGR